MNCIQPETWKKVNDLYRIFLNCFSVRPKRVMDSVEDGVALVYGKKVGIFNRVYREFFIEVHNDLSISYLATWNYRLRFSPVSMLPQEDFNAFLRNMKLAFKAHFL